MTDYKTEKVYKGYTFRHVVRCSPAEYARNEDSIRQAVSRSFATYKQYIDRKG